MLTLLTSRHSPRALYKLKNVTISKSFPNLTIRTYATPFLTNSTILNSSPGIFSILSRFYSTLDQKDDASQTKNEARSLNSKDDEISDANSSSVNNSTETASAAASPAEPVAEASPASSRVRLKSAVAQYGAIVVVFHVSLALTSLGCFYALVSFGVDVDGLFALFGAESNSVATNLSTFALAYAAHKLLAPVRIGITLSVAPLIVKWLRNIKVLKKR